jgi:hypothetical protein
MGNEGLPNIYYMTAQVAYKKGKIIHRRSVWVVSRYTTPADIMAHDSKTMSRLDQELYGKAYKGKRQVILRDVSDVKPVGKVNRNAV